MFDGADRWAWDRAVGGVETSLRQRTVYEQHPFLADGSNARFVPAGFEVFTPGDWNRTRSAPRYRYLGRFEIGSRATGSEASQLTRSSSKTPLRIFTRMSLVACSNASSTCSPERALVSTNNKLSSFAHNSASSVVTSRFRLAGPASSEHRSVLFPTRMHVRCGSAC